MPQIEKDVLDILMEDMKSISKIKAHLKREASYSEVDAEILTDSQGNHIYLDVIKTEAKLLGLLVKVFFKGEN